MTLQWMLMDRRKFRGQRTPKIASISPSLRIVWCLLPVLIPSPKGSGHHFRPVSKVLDIGNKTTFAERAPSADRKIVQPNWRPKSAHDAYAASLHRPKMSRN